VVDARPVARGLRFLRLRAGVVLHQREVDHAVGHVAREVVAGLAGLGIAEAEDLLVEVAGALHVVDLERDVDDAVHAFLHADWRFIREYRNDASVARRVPARRDRRLLAADRPQESRGSSLPFHRG
jgi:hypothetical protein